MEEIFFTRSKGRVNKMLTVYSNGIQFKLHYRIFDRTNPSKIERANGAKEKRFEVFNQVFYIGANDILIPENYPMPELTNKFINFIKEEKKS